MNDSLIKWHAQELCKLMEKDPNDAFLGNVYVQLEGILNSQRFKNIDAVEPDRPKS